MSKLTNDKKGIVSLGAILIFGTVIVGIGLTIALLAYLLNFSNLGARLSAEALSAAQAGLNEGLIRILRKDYTGGIPAISVGSATANVTIDSINPVKLKITSIGSIIGKRRKLEALVEVDAVTRLMKLGTVTELAL